MNGEQDALRGPQTCEYAEILDSPEVPCNTGFKVLCSRNRKLEIHVIA
jgi:hypothetical protein